MAAMDERLPDGRTIAQALAMLLQQGSTRGVGPVPLGGAKPQPIPVSSFMGDAPPPVAPPPVAPAALATPTQAPVLPAARTGTSIDLGPAVSPAAGPYTKPPFPDYKGPVFVGQRTQGLSPLGKLLAERSALQHPSGGDVRSTAEGFEVRPPEQSPSRLKQMLAGVLHGAALAAQGPTEGAALRALGGGITGGATGAISPKLMKAYTRNVELDRNAADTTQQLGLELGAARVDETIAQAHEREAIAKQRTVLAKQAGELVDYTDPESGEVYQLKPDQAARMAQRDRLRKTEERLVDYTPPNGPTRKVRESLAAQLEQRDRLDNPAPETEEIEVAGRKFKVSPTTAANILEQRSRAGDKPSPATEARIEAELEDEAGTDHLAKRRAADEQASKLRAERDALSAKPLYGREDDARKRRITDLDRQITEAERESAYRQKEADDAFTRRNKAKAKALSAGGGSGTSDTAGGTFNFSAWKQKYPNATPAQIEAVKQRHKGKKFL